MKRFSLKFMIFIVLIFNLGGCSSTGGSSAVQGSSAADDSKKELAYSNLVKYFENGPAHEYILVPEGEFVAVFNPEVKNWIQKKFDLSMLQTISEKLKPSLDIQLTTRGFVKAANRDLGEKEEKDETNYDAVWVRDSAWVFWDLQEVGKLEDAKKLILALWDYYASPQQIIRFESVIKNPALVKDKMAVPHIRFDGNSPQFEDVKVKGQAEVWNHRQMDAHGLFMMALFQGLETGLIKISDFNPSRIKVLSLFPQFFDAVKFWSLEDAGAWEEVDRTNTSSIAIVTRALLKMNQLKLISPKAYTKIQSEAKVNRGSFSELISTLVKKGSHTVHDQIKNGGESPNYSVYSNPNLFRRSDAALFNVILPSPLEGVSESELRLVMSQLEALKKPAGVLRYFNDSYQSGNFWIKDPNVIIQKKQPDSGTSDTSDQSSFNQRLAALIPHTEAQWFFDSQLSMSRLELYKLSLKRGDRIQAEQDLQLAMLHLKRSLGQITGHFKKDPLLTADGLPVKDWQLPESINSIVLGGKLFYVPSPIVPLNWSKASLEMTLYRVKKTLQK